MSLELFSSGFGRKVWRMFRYVYAEEYQGEYDRYVSAKRLVRFVSDQIRLKRNENSESLKELYLQMLEVGGQRSISDIMKEIRQQSTVTLLGKEFCDEPDISDFYIPCSNLSRCFGHVACADRILERMLNEDDKDTEKEKAELDRMRKNYLTTRFVDEIRRESYAYLYESNEEEESSPPPTRKITVKPESVVVNIEGEGV